MKENETRECPRCGSTAYFEDEGFIGFRLKATMLIYWCPECDLYFRKIRGPKKRRSYINMNEDQTVDIQDVFSYFDLNEKIWIQNEDEIGWFG